MRTENGEPESFLNIYMSSTKFSKMSLLISTSKKKESEDFKNFIKEVEKSKKADTFILLKEFHYLLLKKYIKVLNQLEKDSDLY